VAAAMEFLTEAIYGNRFERSRANGPVIAVRAAKTAIHGGCGQNFLFCTPRPAITGPFGRCYNGG
jgi:hypothetical protein